MASPTKTGGAVSTPEHATHDKILDGAECLLSFTGHHFLVTILEVSQDTVRVSFPAKDYPLEGMRADLEFHDAAGFVSYGTRVLEGPAGPGEGILLSRPAAMKQYWHRRAYRVPTDLTVQVRDYEHARRYDAALVDLSAGGARVQTEAGFDYGTTVELTMSLPGEPTHRVLCHVVEVTAPAAGHKPADQQFCLRFLDLDHEAELSITRYVRQRLLELHPVA